MSETDKSVDLNEIKQIIELDGGKFVIVENGKAVLVVCSFEEYKDKLLNKKSNSGQKETKPPIPKELQEEELKLEDLPL